MKPKFCILWCTLGRPEPSDGVPSLTQRATCCRGEHGPGRRQQEMLRACSEGPMAKGCRGGTRGAEGCRGVPRGAEGCFWRLDVASCGAATACLWDNFTSRPASAACCLLHGVSEKRSQEILPQSVPSN